MLRDYEARYRTMGLYLAASHAVATRVIVTSQQSGSAHFYTGLPIVRWDLLAVDLETAIARLRALGRHPVLVVEDWEKPGCGNAFRPVRSRASTGRRAPTRDRRHAWACGIQQTAACRQRRSSRTICRRLQPCGCLVTPQHGALR